MVATDIFSTQNLYFVSFGFPDELEKNECKTYNMILFVQLSIFINCCC